MSTGKIRWLHVSDFHVGKDDYATRAMFASIVEHAEAQVATGAAPDFIFITGDLANRGTANEYARFNQDFLAPLQAVFGDAIKSRTFSVPGNHDVDRTKHQAFDRQEILRPDSRYFDPTVEGQSLREFLFPRFKAYVENDLTCGRGQWVLSPEGAFTQQLECAGTSIGIACINTAWLCKDDHDHRLLSPGKGLLESALQKVRACRLRIVLGHHPLDWFGPDERRRISALLGKAGVVYLHGHMHTAWSEPAYGGGHGFLAVQCGAGFQAREGEIWKNGILWGEIDLERNVLRLQPREWSADHQDWGLAAGAFPENHRHSDWWEFPLPHVKPAAPSDRSKSKTAAPVAGTATAAGPVPATNAARPAVSSWLPQLFACDDAQLVANLLSGKCSLQQIDEAVQENPQTGLEIVRHVATQQGGPWWRLLAAKAMSFGQIPAQDLIALAFDDRLGWGPRFPPLAGLRFLPRSQRAAAKAVLLQFTGKGAVRMDALRLVIYGLGFLGDDAEVRWLLEQESALEEKYPNEKLGSYALLAYLHAYLAEANESDERSVLGDFTRTYAAAEKLGNSRLGFYDYLDELQCLRPAKALPLFRHLRDKNHHTPLGALLAAMSRRPNALLLNELTALGENDDNANGKLGALHAAAYIGSTAAVDRLRDSMDRNVDGARAAFLLAAGMARDMRAMPEVEAAIKDETLSRNADWLHDERHNALWAAGELGRVDPDFGARVLKPHLVDPKDDFGRGLAWLGLAKAGRIPSHDDLATALENAVAFFERLLIATAGGFAGEPRYLALGIRGTIENHSPLYRLLGHVEKDVRQSLIATGGAGGRALVELMDLGDFT
jgi:hypothetical protein